MTRHERAYWLAAMVTAVDDDAVEAMDMLRSLADENEILRHHIEGMPRAIAAEIRRIRAEVAYKLTPWYIRAWHRITRRRFWWEV